MHAERQQLAASLEVALSQRDTYQQELVRQDPAYEVLEARLAEVMAQLSDRSSVRENNPITDAQRSQLGSQEG